MQSGKTTGSRFRTHIYAFQNPDADLGHSATIVRVRFTYIRICTSDGFPNWRGPGSASTVIAPIHHLKGPRDGTGLAVRIRRPATLGRRAPLGPAHGGARGLSQQYRADRAGRQTG